MNEQENKQTNEKKNWNRASESMKEITCHLIESFKVYEILAICSRLPAVSLDKRSQQLIEFDRVLPIGKMTGPVENLHPRIRRTTRKQIEQSLTLI